MTRSLPFRTLWLLLAGWAALLTLLFTAADYLFRPEPFVLHVTGFALLAIGNLLLIKRFIFHRLEQVYQRLLQIRRERSHDHVVERADPILGIEESLNRLQRHVRAELIHLHELESFRRDFIGNVSHELRTPIFAIQGYLDTLLEGAVNDPAVSMRFLQQAMANTERLQTLVHDLMVVSVLESGQFDLNKEPFTLYETVLDVFQQIKPRTTFQGRDVKLRMQAKGLETQKVLADPDRVKQVLVNLIDNAIKYGKPDGEVSVILARDGDKVAVSVQDEGEGIPDEHLPHLFDRFYRVDKHRSRESGGTGLGLSIVKQLVEAHGEHIHVDSTLGEGTRFTFTLALTSAD